MTLASLRTRLEHWLHRQWQYRGAWAWSMAPFALLFGLILKIRANRDTRIKNQLRQQSTQQQSVKPTSRVPVLVVGNIYIGGTGKTPVVIALVQHLRDLGWNPGVISRGYGTRLGPIPLVGQGSLEASLYGDEPALIAQLSGAPIAVHPNRLLAHDYLLSLHPEIDLIIADDGLQHLKLHRDFEIVVQDSREVGNGWLLPAGPLREPKSRLDTVQAIITREDASTPSLEQKESVLLTDIRPSESGVRHTKVKLHIVGFKNLISSQWLEPQDFLTYVHERKVSAIAAIANPSRFFSSLHSLGLTLSETHCLPDHFPFVPSPFHEIAGDVIIMTAKDAVKCADTSDMRLWIAQTELCFTDPQFLSWLHHQLKSKTVRLNTESLQ